MSVCHRGDSRQGSTEELTARGDQPRGMVEATGRDGTQDPEGAYKASGNWGRLSLGQTQGGAQISFSPPWQGPSLLRVGVMPAPPASRRREPPWGRLCTEPGRRQRPSIMWVHLSLKSARWGRSPKPASWVHRQLSLARTPGLRAKSLHHTLRTCNMRQALGAPVKSSERHLGRRGHRPEVCWAGANPVSQIWSLSVGSHDWHRAGPDANPAAHPRPTR